MGEGDERERREGAIRRIELQSENVFIKPSLNQLRCFGLKSICQIFKGECMIRTRVLKTFGFRTPPSRAAKGTHAPRKKFNVKI